MEGVKLIIEELEPQNISTEIHEGMLLEAIETYIELSNFPKNIIAKKLDLSEKNLKASIRETEAIIDKGSESIEQLMEKSQRLNNRCNDLLRKLRRIFSFT